MVFQGHLTEAESMFSKMKMAGCSPDVVTYTAMIHAYNAAGKFFLSLIFPDDKNYPG